jgi:hypothetical protein
MRLTIPNEESEVAARPDAPETDEKVSIPFPACLSIRARCVARWSLPGRYLAPSDKSRCEMIVERSVLFVTSSNALKTAYGRGPTRGQVDNALRAMAQQQPLKYLAHLQVAALFSDSNIHFKFSSQIKLSQ